MARRAKGEGSLYFDQKRQSWRWHGYYIDKNGEKKFKNFYAKKQSDVKKKKLMNFSSNLKMKIPLIKLLVFLNGLTSGLNHLLDLL